MNNLSLCFIWMIQYICSVYWIRTPFQNRVPGFPSFYNCTWNVLMMVSWMPTICMIALTSFTVTGFTLAVCQLIRVVKEGKNSAPCYDTSTMSTEEMTIDDFVKLAVSTQLLHPESWIRLHFPHWSSGSRMEVMKWQGYSLWVGAQTNDGKMICF